MKKRQNREQVPLEHFDQRMRALVERRISPSLAAVVVQGDDTMVARGYGWSDLEQGSTSAEEKGYDQIYVCSPRICEEAGGSPNLR